jgi:hypothetical protein
MVFWLDPAVEKAQLDDFAIIFQCDPPFGQPFVTIGVTHKLLHVLGGICWCTPSYHSIIVSNIINSWDFATSLLYDFRIFSRKSVQPKSSSFTKLVYSSSTSNSS